MQIRHLSVSMFLVLAGCATSLDPVDSVDRNVSKTQRNINSSLSVVDKSSKFFTAQTQLSEVERALKENDIKRAKFVLELMLPPPPPLLTEYLFLLAQTAIAERQGNTALSLLADKRLINSEMDSVQTIKFAKLKSDA